MCVWVKGEGEGVCVAMCVWVKGEGEGEGEGVCASA